MLRVLVAAADDLQRSVPHLRAAADSSAADAEGDVSVDADAVAEEESPSRKPDVAGSSPVRMVLKPGSAPAPPPGPPGQVARVPVADTTAGALVAAGADEAELELTPEENAEAEKAYAMTARANKLIAGGLHNCPDWEDVRGLYFAAAAHFQAAQLHMEAGEAFSNAAAICRVYGSPLEVATAAGHGIDSFRLADPVKAIGLLKEVMEIHKEGERPKLEAKAAKDIGELYDALGELQPALDHYKRAMTIYAEKEITRNFFLKTLERVAQLYALLGQYRPAIEHFEQLVEAAIRGTRVTDRYLRAMLCLLADAQGDRQAGTLAKAKVVFDRYQDYDEFLQKGVEHNLIRGIIRAFDKASLAMFDETEKAFFEFRPRDDWHVELLARIRANLFEYLRPYL